MTKKSEQVIYSPKGLENKWANKNYSNALYRRDSLLDVPNDLSSLNLHQGVVNVYTTPLGAQVIIKKNKSGKFYVATVLPAGMPKFNKTYYDVNTSQVIERNKDMAMGKFFKSAELGTDFYKLAYGPKVVYTPLQEGVGGKYFTPQMLQKFLDDNPKITNDYPKGWETDGIILKTTVPIPNRSILNDKEVDKLITRHELKHWKNWKEGKYSHTLEPTLKGVSHTLLNELSANWSQTGGVLSKKIPIQTRVKATALGTKASLKAAYPKGILKALIGIK